MPDATDMYDDKVDQLEFTSVRIHELALQRWLYTHFPLSAGYPTPVVFATPRDAHAEFSKLFSSEHNPFAYLNDLKDAKGNQVFQPNPSNIFYPLISVKRVNWQPRPSQSYGIHRNRAVYYPTVEAHDAPGVTLNHLAYAAQMQHPNGWDFTFQVNYLCKTPQTMSIFVNRLQRALWMMGGTPQTYILSRYPPPHGPQNLRTYLVGGIDNVTTEADNENNQEIQVSFTLVVEGFYVDYRTVFKPVLWEILVAKDQVPLSPDNLNTYFDLSVTYPGADDVRIGQDNPAINSRPGLPPPPSA